MAYKNLQALIRETRKREHQNELENTGQIEEEGLFVCPYCFFEEYDAFDHIHGEGEQPTKCPKCKKTFILNVEICATYTSKKDIS